MDNQKLKVVNDIEEWLRQNNNGKIDISGDSCDLINLAQELISNERYIIREEKKIVIPEIELWTKTGETVNAMSTKIGDKYYVFVNRGGLNILNLDSRINMTRLVPQLRVLHKSQPA